MSPLSSVLKKFGFLFIIILSLFLFLLIFPIGSSRYFLINLEEEKLRLSYESLSAPIGEFLLNNKSNDIIKTIRVYSEKKGDGLTVNNTGGNLSFHSDKHPLFSNVSISVPLIKNEKLIGTIIIDHFSPAVESDYNEIIMETLLIFTVLLFLLSAGVFRLSGSFAHFKNEMIGAMKTFADGNNTIRIFPRSKGYIKDFTDSFNNLADTLSSNISGLIKEKEELQTIVSSISSGIAVLDKKGKIILANEVFMEMFNNTGSAGRFYWEVIINAKFSDLISKIGDENTSLSGEITYINRTYRVHLSFVPRTSETIIIFYDLTDIKNLEKIKKDFVDNVSHELKTPLTSIKGFTESLLEEEKDTDKKHILEIILRNTVRLDNIVRDLLSLSELEETSIAINNEKVNLPGIFKNIKDIFSIPLKMKNLALDIIIDEALPEIDGDPFKIEQLFVNLIDNAIKYTDTGRVSVRAYPVDDSVIAEIADTGPGIPEEHIPRLFERFYVVNKARSKSLGGTGLGLSIVKHILLLHRGKISVESRPGRGTKFIITLPLRAS